MSTLKPFAPMPKETFHLPVEMAVIVPSTKNIKDPIGEDEFEKRTNEVRRKLVQLFGGNTTVKGVGGYKLAGKEIRENVNMVYSYSKRKDWVKHRQKLLKYLQEKKKAWQQNQLGVIWETDLYYI